MATATEACARCGRTDARLTGASRRTRQIPPSRLVECPALQRLPLWGFSFTARSSERASGGSRPFGSAAPIGQHAPRCVCAGSCS